MVVARVSETDSTMLQGIDVGLHVAMVDSVFRSSIGRILS